MMLIPKGWADFQHYKDRSPPWIKLHRDLLNNRDFMMLPLASKALAPMLWLLASESVNGEFDASTEELAFRLRMSDADIDKGLKALINKGFFLDASTMLAPCLQGAIPEGEGEGEGEERQKAKSDDLTDFDSFWSRYPRKQGKEGAMKKWKKMTHDERVKAMGDCEARFAGHEKQFIPYGSSYLNQRMWDDEIVRPSQGGHNSQPQNKPRPTLKEL